MGFKHPGCFVTYFWDNVKARTLVLLVQGCRPLHVYQNVGWLLIGVTWCDGCAGEIWGQKMWAIAARRQTATLEAV